MNDVNDLLGLWMRGELTEKELRDWAERAAPRFVPDTRDLDAYAEWELRSRRFASTLTSWLKKAQDADLEESLLAYTGVCAVGRALGVTAIARPSFWLGHHLLVANRPAAAVPALEDAVAGLSELADEADMELAARDALIDALTDVGRTKEAWAQAEAFSDRSRALGHRVYEAAALRQRGRLIARLGMGDPLPALRQAVELRRGLEPPPEWLTRKMGEFLEPLGRLARERGSYLEAMNAFMEWADLDPDPAIRARVTSELGHTCLRASEGDRGASYLQEAAKQARDADDERGARLWEMQSAVALGRPVDATVIETAVTSETEAYEASALASALAEAKRVEDAAPVARRVLVWAQQHRNTELEINMRSVLAEDAMRRDDPATAIRLLHRAIYLADRFGWQAHGVGLRYNLTQAFLRNRNGEDAFEVAKTGIAWSQTHQSTAPSSEERQQIAAAAVPLYEVYARLTAESQPANFMAATEHSRAENLLLWAVQSDLTGESLPEEADRLLNDLRALEVEQEVLHMARTVELEGSIKRDERRQELLAELRGLLGETADSVLLPRSHRAQPLESAAELVGTSQPATSVVYLYSTFDGVCVAVIADTTEPDRVSGHFVSWPRTERDKLFSEWHQKLPDGSRNLEQLLQGGPLDARGRALSATAVEQMVRGLDQYLVKPLRDLLSPLTGHDLIVIPHGELTLAPLWGLLDAASPGHALTLAPSMALLRQCLGRDRSAEGGVVTVPDATGSLDHVPTELRAVSRWAADLPGDCAARSVATFEQLVAAAREARLLHVSAHGVHDGSNPYWSGLVCAADQAPCRVISRYLNYSGFSDRKDPDGYRLLTVAECMAELRLRACRLAVLSACQSGVSRLHGAGEMTGLPAAMLIGGARSVVATLWHVSDAASTVLMHHFYSYLDYSADDWHPAKALARARRRLATTSREEAIEILGGGKGVPTGDPPFTHPKYTDAFQCYGAP
ncbi:CHAT domain-containing tetratricopeptide repeat protein [Streptomyces sp. NRRL S-448]|uniref:CHAT domain-containing tetratricopeptide repeat protein n=1 Tax=Streptomyces sp. NRRL S-448 TaxID=1463907 RepID=UPI003561B95A